jgi:membrane protein DedA with SNARE-associated domain/rhodanese-related sulfurtransferase
MTQTSQFLVSHGQLFIFLIVLVEQVGLPLPAVPFLLAAGALSADGKFNLPLGIGLTILACTIADTFWFYLGRYRGVQVLRFLCRISLERDSCVRRTQNVFTRYGLRGLLVAKFVPGLGTVAPPLAGMFGISTKQFILVNGAGSLLYAVCFLGLGYLFNNQIDQLGMLIGHIGGGALGLFGGFVVLFIAYKFYQRQRLLRELRGARITVSELREKIAGGENLLILDLRSSVDLDLDPAIILGAVHVEMEKIGNYSNQIVQDRDVVVYCSCPNEFASARVALLLKNKGFSRVRPLLGGIDAWRKENYPTEILVREKSGRMKATYTNSHN